MDDLEIETVGGMCPVQGYGTFRGLRWYFRARHDGWEWIIATMPGADPLDAYFADGPSGHFWAAAGPYGPTGGEDAGYMPLPDAVRRIQDSAAKFAREMPGVPSGSGNAGR